MSYIGASPTTAAFPFDQFSGNGSTTAFTMSYAPASTTSIVVSVSGVVQNPNTYSVSGLTLTFSGAPPTGTNNIGVLFLGLPASGVTTPGNTAYLTTTSFTATAGQTTFTPSGTYQVGFINVIRNGSQLAPADFTATNGTTVVLNNACVAGDVVVTQGYTLTSISNALPSTGGTVTGATTFNSTVSINGANGSGYTGYKNRIINGGMVIDQRNNGASVTPATTTYTLDRWFAINSLTSKYTVQQNAASVTPPVGFTNYLGVTSLSSYSVGATESFELQQRIEGYNVSDLAWGTASAATITFSFWVRSSLTGTFGGWLGNSAADRTYVFSYTISAANTWEQKTITIVGPTSGTWLTTSGIGMFVIFSLGAGSTYTTTAGVWNNSLYRGVTGQQQVVGTNGATFYVTGVQLERGSNATSFEFRDYGRELQMCQRYFYAPLQVGVGDASASFSMAFAYSTTLAFGVLQMPVTMRATPTVTSSGSGTLYFSTAGASYNISTVLGINEGSQAAVTLYGTTTGTAGYGGWFRRQAAGGYVQLSAEL